MGPDRRGGGDERARGGAGGAPGAVRGGACPNLLQRRSGPGPTGRRSAKYQRFFSRASARSGPLQQIRTTCAAVGRSGRCAAVRAEAAAGAPDAETCTSHSKVQFQPSFSSAKCTFRRGRGRSRPSRTAAPVPPRNISDDPGRKAHFGTNPGEKGPIRETVYRLIHLRNVNWQPPAGRPAWTRPTRAGGRALRRSSAVSPVQR